jgi:hypothetical protein
MRVRRLIQGFAVVVCLLASPEARAARLIAVLPLDVTNARGKLDGPAQAAIEEMLRDVATDALSVDGWTVLSPQNQLQLLRDNGVDPTKCGEQNCQLATAREIKADEFLSGAVQYSDGEFTASIRLIDTASGRILATQRLKGKAAKDLREEFESKARDFFVKAGVGQKARETIVPPPAPRPAPVPVIAAPTEPPRVTKSPVRALVGTIRINARPRSTVVVDLVDPDGKKWTSAQGDFESKEARPGVWRLVAHAPGFESESRSVEIQPDDDIQLRIDLKPLGALTVKGSPLGAAAVVTGPGGFRDEGGIPWAAASLTAGNYHVKVVREGYDSREFSVDVNPGAAAQVEVNLKKKIATPAEGVAK